MTHMHAARFCGRASNAVPRPHDEAHPCAMSFIYCAAVQALATQRHLTEQLLSSVANSAPYYDADSEHDSDEEPIELAAQLPSSASQCDPQVCNAVLCFAFLFQAVRAPSICC